MYLMSHAFRTVIRLETDSGHVGLGETLGSKHVYELVQEFGKEALGDCVHERNKARRAFAKNIFANRHGRNGYAALAGLELARWDASARILECPLCELIGGANRQRIAVVAPLPACAIDSNATNQDVDKHFADLSNVQALVDYALGERAQHGFESFKYKSTAKSAKWDVEVMTALRDALGPDAKLRFDPNAGYGVAEALRLCGQLESLALEWYEDPTDGIDGLATLRARLKRPIATNMCVVQFDQIAPALAQDAIDVLLADIFMWGGIEHFADMVSVANACGLEVAVHSLFESGIGTASNLHLAAAFPIIRRANDSGAHMLMHDVLLGDPLAIDQGHMSLPAGPGLGVDADVDALQRLKVDSFSFEL